MNFQDISRFVLGRDSGWIVRSHTNEWAFSIGDLGFRGQTLRLTSPQGMPYSLSLNQLGAGLPLPEFRDADHAQTLLRDKLNKVLTGPHETDVHESDLNGMYGSLSLGISTEGSQNLSIIWFGDVATIGSMVVGAAPQLSIAAQLGFATAVAIVPTGSSGVFLTKGHAALSA